MSFTYIQFYNQYIQAGEPVNQRVFLCEIFPDMQLGRESFSDFERGVEFITQFTEVKLKDLGEVDDLIWGNCVADWVNVPTAQMDSFVDWGDVEGRSLGAKIVIAGTMFYIKEDTRNEDDARVFLTNPEYFSKLGYEFEIISGGKVVDHPIPKIVAKPSPSETVAEPSLAPPVVKTTIEEKPVMQKFRDLVRASTANSAGHFQMYKGNLYICTGSGKSWYCHDNSAGDSSLEGDYVCYEYYVLADDEQIAEYERQKAEVAERKQAKQKIQSRWAKLIAKIKEGGESTAATTGEAVFDTRTHHVGAGYGPGYVWRVEGERIGLAYYTASNVDEWKWQRWEIESGELLAELNSLLEVQNG